MGVVCVVVANPLHDVKSWIKVQVVCGNRCVY